MNDAAGFYLQHHSFFKYKSVVLFKTFDNNNKQLRRCSILVEKNVLLYSKPHRGGM